MSSTDFITDLLSGLELFTLVNIFLGSKDNSDMHVIWGSLTFVFMLTPGLMVLLQMISSYLHIKAEIETEEEGFNMFQYEGN